MFSVKHTTLSGICSLRRDSYDPYADFMRASRSPDDIGLFYGKSM